MNPFNSYPSLGSEIEIRKYNKRNFLRKVCGKCGEPWKIAHPCKVARPVDEFHGFEMTTYHIEAPTASRMDKIQVERQVRAEAVRIWKAERAL